MAKDRGLAVRVETRKMLTANKRDYVMFVLFRHLDAYELARETVTVESFGASDKWLAAIWTICEEHYNEFHDLPNQAVLFARYNDLSEEDDARFSVEDNEAAELFLTAMYEVPEEELSDKVAFNWLQQYLEDRLLQEVHNATASAHVPTDMLNFFENRREMVARVQALSIRPLESAFVTGWDDPEQQLRIRSTSCSFIDILMDGGHAGGEVNGLMGPFAGGKTMLGVQLTARCARDEYLAWLQENQEPSLGCYYHFSYEEPLSGLRLRGLNSLTGIPRKSLAKTIKTRAYETLSYDMTSMKDYERILYDAAIQQNVPILFERQRFEVAKEALDSCWRIVNMTGSDKLNPARGAGYVQEIGNIILQDQAALKAAGRRVHVAMVLVDYALVAIDRYINAVGKSNEDTKYFVKKMPSHMKNQIAARHNCPVWILQQLNTEAQAAPPGRLPRITDSAEGKAFAEACDFLFAIGTADNDRYAVFGGLKTRREEKQPPIVVRVRGDMGVIEDVSTHLRFDPIAKRIVSIAEYQRLQPVVGAAGQAAPQGSQDSDEDMSADDVVESPQPARTVRRAQPRPPAGPRNDVL